MSRALPIVVATFTVLGATNAATQDAPKEPTRWFALCDIVSPLDRPFGEQIKLPRWWRPLYPDEVYLDLQAQCRVLGGPELRNDGPVLEVVRIYEAIIAKEGSAYRTALSKYGD